MGDENCSIEDSAGCWVSECTSWNIYIRDSKTRLSQGAGVRNVFLEEVCYYKEKEKEHSVWLEVSCS